MTLKLINISKNFGNKVLFDNLNIEFKNGLNFIIGRNGVGKSTLLNIIYGIDCDYKGDVIKDNISISYNIIDDFNINSLSVIDNIRLVTNDNVKINYYLDKFKLSKKKNKKVSKLSKGERDRVSIIRTILSGDNCLIFDEFTANLDPKLKRIVLNELKQVKDKIIIISTNELFLADEYADVIINLNKKEYKVINNILEVNKEIFKPKHFTNNYLLLKYSFKRLLVKPFLLFIILFLTIFSSFLLINSLNVYNIDRDKYTSDIFNKYGFEYFIASHNSRCLYDDDMLYYEKCTYTSKNNNSKISTNGYIGVTKKFKGIEILDDTVYVSNRISYNGLSEINVFNEGSLNLLKHNIKVESIDFRPNKNVFIVSPNTYKYILNQTEIRTNMYDDIYINNKELFDTSKVFINEYGSFKMNFYFRIKKFSDYRRPSEGLKLHLDKDVKKLEGNDIIVGSTALYSILNNVNFKDIYPEEEMNFLNSIHCNNLLDISERNININDLNVIGVFYSVKDGKPEDAFSSYIYVSDELYDKILNCYDSFNKYIYEQYLSDYRGYFAHDISNLKFSDIDKIEFGEMSNEIKINLNTEQLYKVLFYFGIPLLIIGLICIIYYFYELNKLMFKDYIVLYMNHYTTKDIHKVVLYNHLTFIISLLFSLLINSIITKFVVKWVCQVGDNVSIIYNILPSFIFIVLFSILIILIDTLFSYKIKNKNVLGVMKHE